MYQDYYRYNKNSIFYKINTYINQLYNEGEIKMAAEYMRFIDYMM